MSFINLDSENDISNEDVVYKTSYDITSLTAAQNKNINTFVANASSTGYLTNEFGESTNIPLSSVFRHISNFYFTMTAYDSIPISHEISSLTSKFRAIHIGRNTIEDSIMSGTITATISFGNTTDNNYIDIPERSLTSSIGRKGKLVNATNTANNVGTVFYDTGLLVFHGGSGSNHFLMESSSGFSFGSASADRITINGFAFQSTSIIKRTTFFCRALNKQFNYTNNPTALKNINTGSITGTLTANPRTYITTVGLHNSDGELLAVGKLSKPLLKTFSIERTIATQIQY